MYGKLFINNNTIPVNKFPNYVLYNNGVNTLISDNDYINLNTYSSYCSIIK